MILEPIISEKLVEKFERLFPNILPNQRGVTEADVAYLQGQQSVIKRMRFLYEDDQPDEN